MRFFYTIFALSRLFSARAMKKMRQCGGYLLWLEQSKSTNVSVFLPHLLHTCFSFPFSHFLCIYTQHARAVSQTINCTLTCKYQKERRGALSREGWRRGLIPLSLNEQLRRGWARLKSRLFFAVKARRNSVREGKKKGRKKTSQQKVSNFARSRFKRCIFFFVHEGRQKRPQETKSERKNAIYTHTCTEWECFYLPDLAGTGRQGGKIGLHLRWERLRETPLGLALALLLLLPLARAEEEEEESHPLSLPLIIAPSISTP